MLEIYESLTVRMLFYRLVSLHRYDNDRNFYKRLQYSLKILRKLLPELNQKFEETTRMVSRPDAPRPPIELWVEKSSLEFFLRRWASRYHVPILAERGFGSITMFVKATRRAERRGVNKILFISDHDPSGLMINRVTGREGARNLHERRKMECGRRSILRRFQNCCTLHP